MAKLILKSRNDFCLKFQQFLAVIKSSISANKSGKLSFFGTSVKFSLAFVILPIIIIDCVYLQSAKVSQAVDFSVLFLTLGLLVMLLEEIFWALLWYGFLIKLPQSWRTGLFGLIWIFWHTPYENLFRQDGSLIAIFFTPICYLLLACFVMFVLNRTKSLLNAVMLYACLDCYCFPRFAISLEFSQLIFAIIATGIIWSGLLLFWPNAYKLNLIDIVDKYKQILIFKTKILTKNGTKNDCSNEICP